MASPSERHLSQEQFEHFRRRLRNMRRQLLMDYLRRTTDEQDQESEMRTDVGDELDVASFERRRDLELTLSTRERDQLREIDDALERLDRGTYGICEVSGDFIPLERLEVVPTARVTVEVAEELEHERSSEREQEVSDEDETYSHFSRVEASEGDLSRETE